MLNGVDTCAIEGGLIRMSERYKAEGKDSERNVGVPLF